MQRHLDPLVGVLVVHVVDDVQRVHVRLGEPVERLVERAPDVVVVELVLERLVAGATCSPETSSRPPLIA